jgi:HD-like signal output (HDOD) protein
VEIGRVVASDPALAAKILQLANSAAFGPPRVVTSIAQAVSYLGIELVRCLALTSSVFAHCSTATARQLEGMQTAALSSATLARKLVRERADADTVFTAALLRDVGEAVLVTGLAGAYAEIRREAEATGEPVFLAERRVLGATHADVGAWLLGLWGLPRSLAELVAHHHEPSLAPPELHLHLAVIHVADAFTQSPDRASEDLVDHAFLASLGLAEQMAAWRGIAELP